MDTVLRTLGDSTIRGWYLVICFAMLVLPMIALTYWYHSRMHLTEGGRDLMKRQAGTPARRGGGLGQVAGGISEAISMARDIASGKYGNAARMMQNRVYWLIGFWLLANVIGFGILLWADEVNRVPT
jgi:hypothetical protein